MATMASFAVGKTSVTWSSVKPVRAPIELRVTALYPSFVMRSAAASSTASTTSRLLCDKEVSSEIGRWLVVEL